MPTKFQITKIYNIDRIMFNNCTDNKFWNLPLKAQKDLMKKDLPKRIIYTNVEQVIRFFILNTEFCDSPPCEEHDEKTRRLFKLAIDQGYFQYLCQEVSEMNTGYFLTEEPIYITLETELVWIEW